MRIEVTAEDIANGDCGNPQSCALALAFQRHGISRPWVCGVGAKLGRASLNRKGHARIYLPPEAQLFARQFDERKPVEPFAFDLDVTL